MHRPFARTLWSFPGVAAFVVASAVPASAQEPAQPAPAYIAVVDGTVTVERDGRAEPAAVNMPFVSGDRLSSASGRAEILFPDGSALDIDQFTAIDLQDETLIRLDGGRIMLTVFGVGNSVSPTIYQVDAPAASMRTRGPGEYRFSLTSRDGTQTPEAELMVYRGEASITTERGSIAVRAGEFSFARFDEAPAFPRSASTARFDAFGRWVEAGRAARTTTASAQYLPRELQMYGSTFDQNGTWESTPSFGEVWYPSVGAGWQPYYNGYWSPIPSYGWTWIGFDRWAWPTHHYGRWGFSGARWFWIPGRTWGSAWVTWGAAPGYVGWCPLGFDNRAVLPFSPGVPHTRAAWVVVPRDTFGIRGNHGRSDVSLQQLPRATPFVAQSRPPIAVPRQIAATPPRPRVVAASPTRPVAAPRAVPRQNPISQSPPAPPTRVVTGAPVYRPAVPVTPPHGAVAQPAPPPSPPTAPPTNQPAAPRVSPRSAPAAAAPSPAPAAVPRSAPPRAAPAPPSPPPQQASPPPPSRSGSDTQQPQRARPR